MKDEHTTHELNKNPSQEVEVEVQKLGPSNSSQTKENLTKDFMQNQTTIMKHQTHLQERKKERKIPEAVTIFMDIITFTLQLISSMGMRAIIRECHSIFNVELPSISLHPLI